MEKFETGDKTPKNNREEIRKKLKDIDLDTIEKLSTDLIESIGVHVIVDDERHAYEICSGEACYEDQSLMALWIRQGGEEKDKIPYIYYNGDGGRKVYFHPETGEKLFDTKDKK